MDLLSDRTARVGSRRAWLRPCLFALAFFWLGGPAPAADAVVGAREYELKAVFLYNFTQFTNWPPGAFADAKAPLVIGILGDDPFGADLDETIRGENVGGRPLAVRRYRPGDDFTDCQILFIGQSETARLDDILKQLKNRAVLTVGDTAGYTQRGVMIRFVTEDNHLRLRIDADAAKAAGLAISSKLLRLAELAEPGKD